MIVLLKIDCFNIEGFSSTTGIVCSVVGVNDIEEGECSEDSSKELGSEERILSSELSFFTSLNSYLYRIADYAL
jgi:hypothetical protein